MAKFSNRVSGLKELSQALNKLATKDAQRIARLAAAEGARKFRDEAKRRAPKDTGRLAENIIIKKYKTKTKGLVEYGIGLRNTTATYGNTKANRRKGIVGQSYYGAGDAYYGYMSEFGYVQQYARIKIKDQWVTLSGKNGLPKVVDVKHIPAKPFLRPAFETQKYPALNAVKNRIIKELKGY